MTTPLTATFITHDPKLNRSVYTGDIFSDVPYAEKETCYVICGLGPMRYGKQMYKTCREGTYDTTLYLATDHARAVYVGNLFALPAEWLTSVVPIRE